MPDTYISQFSGEEIDAALRAAQIISGASTPAELRKKLEIRGDTIPVSAGDSTLISDALTKIPTTSGGGVNPNLLDNWYFGRPVNQRNGWYAPAGLTYWKEDGTTVGPIPKPYPVTRWDGTPGDSTAHFLIDGTSYKFDGSKAVFGYCAAGYTVDRWYSLATSKTVKVESDGFAISDTEDFDAFIQRIEYQGLLGKTVTFSVLAKRLAQGAQSPYITVMNGGGSDYSYEGYDMIKAADNYEISSVTVTLSNTAPTGGYFFVDCVGMAGSSIKILAAKLELGDTQTLAHQDSSGNWILNEIPDFGEQLRRCQRYFVRLTNAYGYGWTYSSSVANFLVPLPTTLRANPVVKLTKNGEIQTINGSKAVTGFEVKGIHPNGLAIDLHDSANALISGTPVTWHDSSMDISADL